MTTKHSPLNKLKAEADEIARSMKAIERNDMTGFDTRDVEKIRASKNAGVFKTAIIMDDKIIKIEMSWDEIRASSEAGLSEFILGLMKESRDTVH